MAKDREQLPEQDVPEDTISINLGFMPEEVSAVLKPMLINRMAEDLRMSLSRSAAGNDEESAVMIISRGNISSDLFEQNLKCFNVSSYSESSSTRVAHANPLNLCDIIVLDAKLDKNREIRNQQLLSLPRKTGAAYVRAGDDLFYVANDKVERLQLDKARMARFDDKVQLKDRQKITDEDMKKLAEGKPEEQKKLGNKVATLTEDQLNDIKTVTGHVRGDECFRVSKQIAEHLQGVNMAALVIEGAKQKIAVKKGEPPEISVAKIGDGPVRQVCIQFPEMGFQSELAPQYARSILSALHDAGVLAEKKVSVLSYGAGGSIHEGLAAGTMSQIESVISLRLHVDPTIQMDKISERLLGLHREGLLKSADYNRLNQEIIDLKAKFASADSTYTELVTQDKLNILMKELSRLTNKTIEELQVSVDSKGKKYYSEIAVVSPTGGKNIFFRTDSYDSREKAEEIARLVFMKMGGINVESMDLSTGYGQMLADTKPEYKKMLDEEAGLEAREGKLSAPTETKIYFGYMHALELRQPFIDHLDRVNEMIEAVSKFIDQINNALETMKQLKINENTAEGKSYIAYRESLLSDLKEAMENKNKFEIGRDGVNALINNSAVEINALEAKLTPDMIRMKEARDDLEKRKGEFVRKEVEGLLREAPNGYFYKATEKDLVQMPADQRSGPLDSMQQFEDAKWLFISKLRNISHGKSHSLAFAASMFIGQQMKNAAFNLCGTKPSVCDCNMEDDIVADVMNGFMKKRFSSNMTFDEFSISRVNVDPFSIPKKVEDILVSDCKTATYTPERYVDAIMWGLRGYPMDSLPASAQWNVATEVEKQFPGNDKFKELFCKSAKGNIVIDPFWREISTDLFNDMITRNPKSGKYPAFTIQPNEQELEWFKQRIQNIKNAAKERITPEKDAEIRAMIGEVVDKFIQKNNMKVDDHSAKVWVRQGSWGGNTQQTLDGVVMSGSNPDRAFYVSGNFVSLANFAKQERPKVAVTEDMRTHQVQSREQSTNAATALNLDVDRRMTGLYETKGTLFAMQGAGYPSVLTRNGLSKKDAVTLGDKAIAKAVFIINEKFGDPRHLTERAQAFEALYKFVLNTKGFTDNAKNACRQHMLDARSLDETRVKADNITKPVGK